MKINAIVYVSPIIDKLGGVFFVDYAEFVDGILKISQAHFKTLSEADDAIKALKKQIKKI